MLHQNIKSLTDTVVALEDSLATGYSKAFHVVSTGTFASMRIKQISVAVGTTAVGNVVIQVYNKRSGIEASLLSSAITHNTEQSASVHTTMLTPTLLVAGDLLYIRVISFTGSAKGLAVTIDFI